MPAKKRSISWRDRYKTPTSFKRRIDDYFRKQKADNSPITFTGFVRFLCISKPAFYRLLKNESEEFAEYRALADDAYMHVQEHYEKLLQRAGSNGGAIFALKNFGWRDDQHVNVDSKSQVINIAVNGNDTKKALLKAVGELND